MKYLFWVLSMIFSLCVICATPGSIIYVIFEWAVNDMQLKDALWEGAKLWMIGIAMIIPMFICYLFAENS